MSVANLTSTPITLDTLASDLAKVSIDASSPQVIDTPTAMVEVINSLEDLPTSPPSLYIDLEGINLCRHGSLSILQIYVLSTQKTYLIDVHVLGSKAFSTPGKNKTTLKTIFESPNIPKVFFDVRNDSDALFSLYEIDLSGIQDLQLMELATRRGSRKFINGLSRCIDRDAPLSNEERLRLVRVKSAGTKLFAPEKGGRYEVFNERPLAKDIVDYCANDVQILPRLWKHYDGKMNMTWRRKVLDESVNRVKLSQTASFSGKGRHMAVAPTGWSN